MMNYPRPYSSQQAEEKHPSPTAPMVYVKEDIVWEYKCITRNLASGQPLSAAELNHLGNDGWELSTMLSHGDMLYCYLKRLV